MVKSGVEKVVCGEERSVEVVCGEEWCGGGVW